MSESRTWYSRCAGYRNGDYARSRENGYIGFRLNGVWRGGCVYNHNYHGSPYRNRSGSRIYWSIVGDSSQVGFRLTVWGCYV